MSEPYRTFPRLPDLVALTLFKDLHGKSLDELRLSSQSSHPLARIDTGSIFTPGELEKFRDDVRSTVINPYIDRKASGASGSSFDRELGSFLLQNLPLTPYEAGFRQVWAFITLVLIPEVGPWRFPKMTDERFVGRPIRNVFGRTWWRAFLLGEDLGAVQHGADPLTEDELYTLIEKTTIGFNSWLAPNIASAVYRFQKSSINRSELVRELTKDLLRVVPWCDLSSLEEDELSSFLDERIQRASERLR